MGMIKLEFKLNKIDTDIINKIHKNYKTDKVHLGEKSSFLKTIKDDEEKENNNNNKEFKKRENKRYITIDGIKGIEAKFEIIAEKECVNDKGRILDKRK